MCFTAELNISLLKDGAYGISFCTNPPIFVGVGFGDFTSSNRLDLNHRGGRCRLLFGCCVFAYKYMLDLAGFLPWANMILRTSDSSLAATPYSDSKPSLVIRTNGLKEPVMIV